jgi:hypothetical protein
MSMNPNSWSGSSGNHGALQSAAAFWKILTFLQSIVYRILFIANPIQ